MYSECNIIQHGVDGLGHQLHGLFSVIILDGCIEKNKKYKFEAISMLKKPFVFAHLDKSEYSTLTAYIKEVIGKYCKDLDIKKGEKFKTTVHAHELYNIPTHFSSKVIYSIDNAYFFNKIELGRESKAHHNNNIYRFKKYFINKYLPNNRYKNFKTIVVHVRLGDSVDRYGNEDARDKLILILKRLRVEHPKHKIIVHSDGTPIFLKQFKPIFCGKNIDMLTVLSDLIYADILVCGVSSLSIFTSFVNVNEKVLVPDLVDHSVPDYAIRFKDYIEKGFSNILNPNNIVGYQREIYPVIKNINQYKSINRRCDDKIYLFQQFYIPSITERYQETMECLQRNMKCEQIDHIFLLNERLYSDEELGVAQGNSKLTQVNTGKRLTFREAFRFASRYEGFLIFSNSDIFFDETIDNVKIMGLETTKSVECLCRYEYRNEKDLKNCEINSNNLNSFDTWIIHSNYIDYKIDIDFYFGLSGCDVHLNYLFYKENYLVLNDNIEIRTYHNHKNESREYYKYQKEIKPPWFSIYRDDVLGIMLPVLLKFDLKFEKYYTTELEFYKKHWKTDNYINIPWTSIVYDKENYKNIHQIVGESIEYLKTTDNYTCCSNPYFESFLCHYKRLKIKKIYTPYKEVEKDNVGGIEIISIPLFSYSFISDKDNTYITKNKTLLYSYYGDKTDMLKNNIKTKDVNIIVSSLFHKINIINLSQEKNYKDILSKTKFLLCTCVEHFWDSIATGSVPILLSKTLELPKHELMEKCYIRYTGSELKELDLLIRSVKSVEIFQYNKYIKKICEEYSLPNNRDILL